ncbi:MAG: UDP-N-acetylmuramoyl-L-alanyl-D-glutamate--2,6-diaminopimelate ligase [Chlorobi bacterium]|nr:UDP-N-acetylmuramoyl-L-alanyl-D-glutamate--2,6-diaminopimelate ligase [Chlorobiota bacterium]
MIELNDILTNIKISQFFGELNQTVSKVSFNSKEVEKNTLFVAVKGTQNDGHKYINNAVDKGANVIVCQQIPEKISKNITYIQVDDSHKALGIIASNFYSNPSRLIKLVGITGTNGKTTVATLLYHLFTGLGYKSGLLSTVENYIGNKRVEATHTTPDSLQINSLLRQMVDDGCEYCFMEVSSHAIDQKRIEALQFDGAVFTNITHDHLDYHKTFNNYIDAKKSLFDNLDKSAFALINNDDRNAKIMVQNTNATIKNYALKSLADYSCKIIENHPSGMLLQINKTEVWVQFIGDFNASNLLAVFAVSQLTGINEDLALTGLSKLKPVTGRLDLVKNSSGIIALVDYAHTPDALQNVLTSLNKVKKKGQQIITVVGAGGNRDKAKRPVMAKNAGKLSDILILTSDNPRDEDPEAILKDMEKGIDSLISKVTVIVDRKQAIKTACVFAKPGDIILVAGKGHETYQEIKGVKYPFNDKEILNDCLN